MTNFLDGPAAGVVLPLRRAPQLLRVVQCRGKFDALDQLADTPQPDESIHVYRLASSNGSVHLLFGGKGRRCSGFYALAEYGYLAEQPADADVRTTAAWRRWAIAHSAAPVQVTAEATA